MSKRAKITQEQAKEWTDNAIESTQSLIELTKALGNMNVDGFTEEGVAEMASSLMAASRNCADTAVHMMRHGQILRQRRQLEDLQKRGSNA